MILDVNGQIVSEQPYPALISTEIQGLSYKIGPDAFAILARDPTSFIQTLSFRDGHFALEYQEGSVKNHYNCDEPDIDAAKVIRAFTLYLQDDERWLTEFNWKKMKL